MIDGTLPDLRPLGHEVFDSSSTRLSVRASCHRLRAVQGDFLLGVRTALLLMAPALPQGAADEGGSVAEDLGRAAIWAAVCADPVEHIEITLARLGQLCRARGVEVGDHRIVSHAVLRAARDLEGDRWTSEVSSSWVAYLGWFTACLTRAAPPTGTSRPGVDDPPDPPAAAGTAPKAPGAGPAAPAAPAAPVNPPARSTTLDDVLALLRARYFPTNENAMDVVLMRLGLRTGVDVRSPRPGHQADPVVVGQVVSWLRRAGYDLGLPDPPERPVPPDAAPSSPSATTGQRGPRRWWRS